MTAKKFWGWFLLAWAIAGIPILLLHGVPGVDTPNHVARLHVLASLQENQALASFYRTHWAILPNLAVDLFITPIVYFFNVNALWLMKVFLINSIGVTGAGYAVTNRAISGKWSAWGLFGLLFSYSYVLGFGFINYLFGIGLALLFVGVQLILKEKPYLRMAVITIGLPILLLNHMLALVLGGMTMVIIAIWQRDKSFGLLGGTALGGICCWIYMKLSATVGLGATKIVYDPIAHHLRNIFFPLYFSNLFRDLSFWLVIVGIVVWMFTKRRASESADPALRTPHSALESPTRKYLSITLFTFFTLIALALPHMAMTSAFISGRISIWTILIAGATAERISVSPGLIFGLLFARSVDITQRFLTWNLTFDQVRQDLRVVEEGSLVYQMTSLKSNPLEPVGWNPSIIHADCLLLLEKNCYINNLFSLPYQQPLQNSPEINIDLRDLYNDGTDKSIELSRQWILWQQGYMSPRLQKRSAYAFFVKNESEGTFPFLGNVLVVRPRYVIYQLR
ncbi:MAG: hypothetical protein WCG75_01285 [Armatimonadota bacterium]